MFNLLKKRFFDLKVARIDLIIVDYLILIKGKFPDFYISSFIILTKLI